MAVVRWRRGQPISIPLAVVDPEYYALVHYKLRVDRREQAEFERAVDEAWRATHTPAGQHALR